MVTSQGIPTMVDAVIRQITQDIYIFSRPFARFGFIPFGGRSTAVRLRSGAVWVLASTPLDEGTKKKIDEMGDVRYIIGPNAVHWLFLDEYKKAYPNAKLIGVEPLLTKKGCPKLDAAYGADAPETKYGFEDEIQACYFSGFANKDVAFYHKASKTLIEADLLLNLPAHEQYSQMVKKPFLLFLKVKPNSWLHRKVIPSVNKEAMKRDAKTVASWDFERIIPCHGDVIEVNGKEMWRSLYKAFL